MCVCVWGGGGGGECVMGGVCVWWGQCVWWGEYVCVCPVCMVGGACVVGGVCLVGGVCVSVCVRFVCVCVCVCVCLWWRVGSVCVRMLGVCVCVHVYACACVCVCIYVCGLGGWGSWVCETERLAVCKGGWFRIYVWVLGGGFCTYWCVCWGEGGGQRLCVGGGGSGICQL